MHGRVFPLPPRLSHALVGLSSDKTLTVNGWGETALLYLLAFPSSSPLTSRAADTSTTPHPPPPGVRVRPCAMGASGQEPVPRVGPNLSVGSLHAGEPTSRR